MAKQAREKMLATLNRLKTNAGEGVLMPWLIILSCCAVSIVSVVVAIHQTTQELDELLAPINDGRKEMIRSGFFTTAFASWFYLGTNLQAARIGLEKNKVSTTFGGPLHPLHYVALGAMVTAEDQILLQTAHTLLCGIVFAPRTATEVEEYAKSRKITNGEVGAYLDVYSKVGGQVSITNSSIKLPARVPELDDLLNIADNDMRVLYFHFDNNSTSSLFPPELDSFLAVKIEACFFVGVFSQRAVWNVIKLFWDEKLTGLRLCAKNNWGEFIEPCEGLEEAIERGETIWQQNAIEPPFNWTIVGVPFEQKNEEFVIARKAVESSISTTVGIAVAFLIFAGYFATQEQRKAAYTQGCLEEQARFMALTSHDMRTPIQIISSAAALGRGATSMAEISELLEAIQPAATVLAYGMQNIMDANSNEIELSPSPCDLREVVLGALRLVRVTAEISPFVEVVADVGDDDDDDDEKTNKRIVEGEEVVSEAGSNSNTTTTTKWRRRRTRSRRENSSSHSNNDDNGHHIPLVMVDGQRLRRCVMHLLTNAFEHTRQGQVIVRLRQKVYEEDTACQSKRKHYRRKSRERAGEKSPSSASESDSSLRSVGATRVFTWIEVEDTGVGMDSEKLIAVQSFLSSSRTAVIDEKNCEKEASPASQEQTGRIVGLVESLKLWWERKILHSSIVRYVRRKLAERNLKLARERKRRDSTSLYMKSSKGSLKTVHKIVKAMGSPGVVVESQKDVGTKVGFHLALTPADTSQPFSHRNRRRHLTRLSSQSSFSMGEVTGASLNWNDLTAMRYHHHRPDRQREEFSRIRPAAAPANLDEQESGIFGAGVLDEQPQQQQQVDQNWKPGSVDDINKEEPLQDASPRRKLRIRCVPQTEESEKELDDNNNRRDYSMSLPLPLPVANFNDGNSNSSEAAAAAEDDDSGFVNVQTMVHPVPPVFLVDRPSPAASKQSDREAEILSFSDVDDDVVAAADISIKPHSSSNPKPKLSLELTPLDLNPFQSFEPSPSAPKKKKRERESLLVLVVEDNDVIRKLTVRGLKAQFALEIDSGRITVDEAENGFEGVNKIDRYFAAKAAAAATATASATTMAAKSGNNSAEEDTPSSSSRHSLSSSSIISIASPFASSWHDFPLSPLFPTQEIDDEDNYAPFSSVKVVALLDINMPVMDGVEAATIMKRRWPKEVLRMAYTARSEFGEEEGKEGGLFEKILFKPCKADVLAKEIRECMKRFRIRKNSMMSPL